MTTTVSDRKFAVVTGASRGIGLELARQCAEHGYDVLMCAEDEGIHAAANQLGARNTPVRADLSTHAGVEELVRAVEASGRPVDALMMNAGVGVGGAFLETPLEEELRMIALNATSLVHLGKRLLPAMAARGEGRVLVTASVVSTAPTPYLAVYGATKAFALSFAEAVRHELKETGVTVTALEPGATDTEFFDRANMGDTKVGQGEKDDPADVARMGFAAMVAGKDSIVASSLKSRTIGLVNEILPESVKARVQAAQTKPGSGRA